MDVASILPLVIGIMGLGGIIFTALRFRRDDTTAIVNQQSSILQSMKSLNDELRITADNLRAERDQLRLQVEQLNGKVEVLRVELREATGRIERKLDNGDN